MIPCTINIKVIRESLGRLAEDLGIKNLILYHTEDRTLETRKKRYSTEAKTAFSGNVWVPDDLEVIKL